MAQNAMTVEQLTVAMARLEQVVLEGQRREGQLRQQIQDLEQRQPNGHGGQGVDVGAAFQALATSQQELLAALKKPEKKITLIDTKGLAKPEKFSGNEDGFLYWRTRVESFVASIFPDMQDVLDWCDDVDVELTPTIIEDNFGAANPSQKTIEGISEISTELYAVLQSLCEKEAFTIVRSAGKGNGLEAWRKLIKRYDPTTGGRRRAMLRSILTPNKCARIEDLYSALETWEEHVRQYESRKKQDGSRHILDEEIKIAVLEHLCPSELEKHLQMNRARFLDYADVRAELITYLETRLGSKMKLSDASGHTASGHEVVPMDVGAFVKGKKGDHKGGGKGKGKGSGGKGKGNAGGGGSGKGGKETRACHNCGKTGHLRKDCWQAGGGSANKGQRPKGGKTNKMPGGKKGGKGSKSVSGLEPHGGSTEPQAEPVEMGFLNLSGLERTEDWSSEEDRTSSELGEGYVKVEVAEEDLRRDWQAERLIRCEEEHYCYEPCMSCYGAWCDHRGGGKHTRHSCWPCAGVRAQSESEGSKQAIREGLKLIPPEEFRYIVDKTICLVKGLDKQLLYSTEEELVEKWRAMQDPLGISRSNNVATLEAIGDRRDEMRLEFLKAMSDRLVDFGMRDPEAPSGSDGPGGGKTFGPADLQPRPVGSSSGSLMHRTIEQAGIRNLDEEIREKTAECEEAETKEDVRRIEAEIASLRELKEGLKKKVAKDDGKLKERQREGKAQLSKDNLLDQGWHDARYYAAVRGGATHSQAWLQEKKRRKAALHRQKGTAARAAERKALDLKWHEEFDSKRVKDEEFIDEAGLDAEIETEAVDATVPGRIKVFSGGSRTVRKRGLKKSEGSRFFQAARTYRKLSQEEVAKFKTETKEDELKVMSRSRVDPTARRGRRMTDVRKALRRQRVKQARRTRAEHKPHMLCGNFSRSHCGKGAKCNSTHSELDRETQFLEKRRRKVERDKNRIEEVNSFGGCTGVSEVEGWTRLTVNFDTGAAITAVPLGLKEGLGLRGDEASARSYKTASGELLSDEGGTLLKGYDDAGEGRSISGRLVNVHRVLMSGSAAGKKNVVLKALTLHLGTQNAPGYSPYGGRFIS